MFDNFCYYLRYVLDKFRKKKCPSYVTIKNELPKDKKKYFRGSIRFCYCKGHDCIRAVFCFDVFYETDRRLHWQNYWFSD